MPIPASICALKTSSASAVASSGRGSDRNRSFARSMAMMSSCLVIAQNGRYGGLSTHATGLFARRWVSAVCSRLSSAYAGRVGQYLGGFVHRARAHRASCGAGWAELDGCQVRSLGDRRNPDPAFWPKGCVGSDSVLPGTARSLRVVLLVVLATVLVVALGRVVGASPKAARCRGPRSPVTGDPVRPQAKTDPALAQTAAGMVRGVVESDHRLFAGIPYAAPPVGPLRFRPPAQAPAWTGVRDATKPGTALHPGPRRQTRSSAGRATRTA